ncbi:MAG: glutamate racemase [Solirubrobacterales bacterium]|nr:glutamate racemase [Solirubrobacterales bacterium]
MAAVSRPSPADRPIGVFDSGVGGLTVLHELLVQLPQEDFVYLADTARFPYGERSAAELQEFSLQIAEELLRRQVKLLVVACNSATAAALPALQERMMRTTLGVDVIGVVRPGAVHAVAATRNGRVGLLATTATVQSGAYAEAITAADPHVDLVQVPCPDLTAIIEGGFPFDQRVVDTVRRYCAPLREARVDTVVLGCTHYPLVRPMLQRILGPGVTIIASGVPLARQVEHVLGSRSLAAQGREDPARPEGEYSFLCTGDPEPFRALGTRFLQMPLGEVVQVDVARHAQPSGARVLS